MMITSLHPIVLLPAIPVRGCMQRASAGLRLGELGAGYVLTRLFAAEIEWIGTSRRILVVEMEGGSLLGISLSRGYFLGIEVAVGGSVEIRPLS